MDAFSFITVMLPVVGWNFVSHSKGSTRFRMFGSDRDKVTEVRNNVIMGSFIISNIHQILLD